MSVETGEDVSNQKYTCSEFNAINKLKNTSNIDIRKCVLVNLRYDRNKKLAYAKPCASCGSLLSYFRFKRVFYTNDKGNYQKLL